MGLLDFLTGGGQSETHEDGSSTTHYPGGTVTTREADGSLRERTVHETTHPLGIGEKITTTYGPKGEVNNVQKGWGNH